MNGEKVRKEAAVTYFKIWYRQKEDAQKGDRYEDGNNRLGNMSHRKKEAHEKNWVEGDVGKGMARRLSDDPRKVETSQEEDPRIRVYILTENKNEKNLR
jgi:hypothetical protein